MRFILKLAVLVCFLSCGAIGQERAIKAVAGPNGDWVRVLVTFMSTGEDSYRLQSAIIDVNRIKNKAEEPTAFYVDLTTTDTLIETGAKQQKILVLRWDPTSEVEVICSDGQWIKQTKGSELSNIVETIKEVIKQTPLDSKAVMEFTLSKGVTSKLASILDSLSTSKLACIRDGK
jgi:hypothetical protein